MKMILHNTTTPEELSEVNVFAGGRLFASAVKQFAERETVFRLTEH